MASLGGGARGALSGAATGAQIGSIVPGVGTAIGAGVGAIGGFFGGLFGGGKKKKPKASDDPASALLSERAKMLQGRADVALDEGLTDLGQASDYFSDLLGSDPAALMEATKAERGKVIDQYDTARQAITEFGPKGGGTTSALAQSRIAQANQLSDLMATGRREAAQGIADIGQVIAGVGLTQEQIASADLNSVLDAALTREGHDITKRGQTMGAWGDVGELAGTVLGGVFGRGEGESVMEGIFG